LLLVVSAIGVALLAIGTVTIPAGALDDEEPLQGIGLRLAAGLLVNFTLLLAGARLQHVIAIGIGLAAFGTWRTAMAVRARAWTPRLPAAAAWSIAGAVVLLLLYYAQILVEPIVRWDARSIWFFQARAIWIGGSLSDVAWNHPSLPFAHTDYPKLVPSLAAQLAFLKGFWNEYFPKASLLIALMPAAFWVFSFRTRSPRFVVLVLAFFGMSQWLSNGYMDGYVVVYSGFTLLFLGRYLLEGGQADLASGLCALGIVLGLKNEGMLVAVSVALALLAGVAAVGARTGLSRLGAAASVPAAVSFALAALPTVLWTWRRVAWGLENDLASDPADAAVRVLGRLQDGRSFWQIGEYLLQTTGSLWLFVAVAVVTCLVTRLARGRLHPGALVALAASALYFAGMFVVYLSTPRDLYFHLTTSAGRTMAVVRMGLVVAVYFCLVDLEEGDGAVRPLFGESPIPPPSVPIWTVRR
jgi:hypothetical protein